MADLMADPMIGAPPLTVYFTDTSKNKIDTWSWDFGDGGSSTEGNPSHLYNAAGSYTVALTVKGPGGSDTVRKAGLIKITEATGSLKVTIVPKPAVTAGAKWKVDEGEWKVSELTVAGLPVGAHSVSFMDLPGWISPPEQRVNVFDDHTTTSSGTYVKIPVVVSITASDPAASEPGKNKGAFVISKTGDANERVTVFLAFTGTARNGVDYVKLPDKITIPAGKSSATLIVKPIDDKLKEKSETVIVTIKANAAYTVGSPSKATVTVLDND